VVSGNLQIEFEVPSDQILWQVDIIDTESDLAEFNISESGLYSIIIIGDQAEGYFNIVWDIAK